MRALTGWAPFSLGDLLYAFAGCWIVLRVVSFCKKLLRRQITLAYLSFAGQRVLRLILILYVWFNLAWGLNYNRRGIADQLQLSPHPYTTEDLQVILQTLVSRLNALDSNARTNRSALYQKHQVFQLAAGSYQSLAMVNPEFSYRVPSVKPSIFSYLGNFLGFAGYYNPFSGEAQVNTTMPPFTQPYTTCHEIGHQLGYAKEHEANFAGYLAAKSSPDPAVRYSVYFDLYTYAGSELYGRDSALLVPLRNQLHPGIRKDFRELKDFFARYENPIEPYIRRLYGRYLRANGQPQGILSYEEVTSWLVAYYKKYGEASF